MKRKIKKTSFEKAYAKRSKVTISFLHKNGLTALPCHCNFEDCQGWQMVPKNLRKHYENS